MACVVFRTDAGRQIGTGHFWRCLSLAEALLAKKTEIVFISRFLPAELENVLQTRQITLLRIKKGTQKEYTKSAAMPGKMVFLQKTDAEQSLSSLQAQGCSPDWIVVDHYALGARWEKAVCKPGSKILVIDDMHNRKHHCDMLLDQNTVVGGDKLYKNLVPEKCDLLLGPGYSLLREDFRTPQKPGKDQQKNVQRLLVSFGGLDAPGNTLKTLRAVKKNLGADLAAGKVKVDVVIGGLNPQKKEIIRYCEKHAFQHYVQTENMACIMARADLAIGTGGIELWERSCMGLPALVFESARNQKEQIKQAAMAGLVLTTNLDGSIEHAVKKYLPALMGNSPLRSLLRKNCQATIDPNGVIRVINRMGIERVSLRPIQESDCEIIYKWRNSPVVRQYSANTGRIGIDEHRQWLKQKLKNKNSILLMGVSTNRPIGVIRYEIEGTAATVSLFLDPAKTNQGLGRRLLASGDAWMKEYYPGISTIQADVLPGNTRSIKIFEALGYTIKLHKLEKVLTNA